ncbi:unnamed protein product [Amaranthus hypochondriacus]
MRTVKLAAPAIVIGFELQVYAMSILNSLEFSGEFLQISMYCYTIGRVKSVGRELFSFCKVRLRPSNSDVQASCIKIADEFLNDTVVTYFECDLLQSLSNNDIMRCFHNMKTRRSQLP